MGAFADTVYMMEKLVLKGFAENEALVKAFYQNEAFADKFLDTCAQTVERSLLSGAAEESTAFKVRLGAKPPDDEVTDGSDVIPGHHGHFCSPQCYCLKGQATPLSLKGDMRKDHAWLWEETFRD